MSLAVSKKSFSGFTYPTAGGTTGVPETEGGALFAQVRLCSQLIDSAVLETL